MTGADSAGDPQVYFGGRGLADYHSLRPVLQESVSLTHSPLDDPRAVWATAPKAIWQSRDGGRSWDLLISHQTWQHVVVVGDGPASG